MILSSLVHTDFQPYLLPNTDAWALPGDKALELLVYLEQQGVRQIYCVPPVKVEMKGMLFFSERCLSIFTAAILR